MGAGWAALEPAENDPEIHTSGSGIGIPNNSLENGPKYSPPHTQHTTLWVWFRFALAVKSSWPWGMDRNELTWELRLNGTLVLVLSSLQQI